MDRRTFLKTSAGATAALLATGCGGETATPPPDDGWDAGPLAHLIPSANHRRVRIKASFAAPLPETPRLSIDGRSVAGVASDSAGRFFAFDADGLAPSTQYTLRLFVGEEPICDEWPLSTLPAPDASPERLRLLVYTCAGGPDDLYDFGSFNAYLPIAHRQRLFARALSFQPDAAIANGDHVYWDMKSKFGWAMGNSPIAWWKAGWFERESRVLQTPNETIMVRAFGPQIAGLYGVRFRSVPMFFLQDDHDYGENDEASSELRTFPPDPFMADLAQATQKLYYPELFADATLPSAHRTNDGLSRHFGLVRFGKLFEALLYDCRRFLTNREDPMFGHTASNFVPPDIESWLVRRTSRSDAVHLAHMPSTPVLWTAGKWGEWYPDAKDADDRLRADADKPYWPAGWGAQHDRLVTAASKRADRTPLFVSGDLHALAAGSILSSNGASLEENPIVSVLCGAVGTGKLGWPSRFRGQLPIPSGTLTADEWLRPIEENGFTLLDVTPTVVRVSMFRWKPEDGEAAIDDLQPFRVIEIPKPV